MKGDSYGGLEKIERRKEKAVGLLEKVFPAIIIMCGPFHLWSNMNNTIPLEIQKQVTGLLLQKHP